jgi:hypothetical protein
MLQFDVQLPPVKDTHQVPDVFATGIGGIEDVGGGCLRFTLYAQQGDEFVVVARLIVPADSVPMMMHLSGKSVGLTVVRAAKVLAPDIH